MSELNFQWEEDIRKSSSIGSDMAVRTAMAEYMFVVLVLVDLFVLEKVRSCICPCTAACVFIFIFRALIFPNIQNFRFAVVRIDTFCSILIVFLYLLRRGVYWQPF